MSSTVLEQILLSLPCHFTWKETSRVGPTMEMNIQNLEEHIEQTIQGTEVESYNLMGFYKTQEKSFAEARECFNKALENTKTKDEKIVCLACLAWLTWKERGPDSSVQETIEEFKRIINERGSENIPEVLTEKAFSISHSGFDQRSYTEAYRCITKALDARPDSMKMKFIRGIVMKDLYKAKTVPMSPVDSAEVQEMQKNWSEIKETSEESREYCSTIYVMSLIEYAIFLHKVNRDYGESGRQLAEQAEKILDESNSSALMMRKLAEYYIHAAKHNTKILEKAQSILDKILESNPDGSRTLQLRGQLFFDKYRFAAKEDKEKFFNEAKTCFYKSWSSAGKRDVSPALDLVQIYQQKYEDTDEPQLVLDVEVLFREIYKEIDKLHDTSKALVHEVYGAFLKAHHKMLVISHFKMSFEYQPSQEDEQPKHPMWDLARDLMRSSELKDQKEGTKTLEWMNNLLALREEKQTPLID